MPYATAQDMLQRFGADELRQLTDRALPLLGEIDQGVLGRALADADGVIDRHLGARYALPLAVPYPADLVRLACDIARYMLHDMSAPELVRDHYDDALRTLREMADGKLPLIDADGAIVPVKGQAFGPGAVRGYRSGAVFGDAFARAWRS